MIVHCGMTSQDEIMIPSARSQHDIRRAIVNQDEFILYSVVVEPPMSQICSPGVEMFKNSDWYQRKYKGVSLTWKRRCWFGFRGVTY